MFQNMFTVLVLLLVSGVEIASCSECCKTGYNSYEWCSSYCCSGWSGLEHCCSSGSSSSYAKSSDCDWLADNVWVAVIIGLGSFGSFVGIIICCVCCIKGCTGNNNRTGPVIVQPGQPQGQGVFMVNNTAASHQGMMMQQHSSYPYGAPMQPAQAAYPLVTPGPSNFGPTNPPPYKNDEDE